MSILVEKYQYCLLYLLLHEESFFKFYRPILIRFYRQLFSNKYLKNLFLIIVNKLASHASLEALTAYIDQAERDGRLDTDEAELYRMYLQNIIESKSFIEDFKRTFINFVVERLTIDYKEKLNTDYDPAKVLATLKSFQFDILHCLSVLEQDDDNLDKLVEEIEGLHGDLYIPFNLPFESCPGVRAHELAIVGAATGVGKSWFLLHSFWQALKAGRRILFISLEMAKSQLYDRLIPFFTGKFPKKNLRLPYTDDLVSIKIHTLDALEDLKQAIYDMVSFFKSNKCRLVFSGIASAQRSFFSFDDVLAEITKYESIYHDTPEVIIVDGLEFMRFNTTKFVEKWYEEAQCVVALKELARDGKFAIMVNSHVVKNVRNRWVYTNDLSGGSEKARVADLILTLAATSTELSYSLRRVLIAKNRMNVSGQKYWFPLLPDKDCAIPSVYSLPDASMRNLDSELIKLSDESYDDFDFTSKEVEEDDLPF